MVPAKRRTTAEGEMAPPVSTVIHLSDGNTTVQTQSPETFSLVTNKNEYHFRIPQQEAANINSSVKSERDAWVQAIDKLCTDWRRKSNKNTEGPRTTLRNTSIAEEDDSETEQEPTSAVANNGTDDANANSNPIYSVIAKLVPKPDATSATPGSPKELPPDRNALSPFSPTPVNQNAVPMSPNMFKSPLNFIPPSPFSPHSSVILSPESPTFPSLPLRLSDSTNSSSDSYLQHPVIPSTPSSLPSPTSSPSFFLPTPPPSFVPPPPQFFAPTPPPMPPPVPMKVKTLTRANLTKAFHWDVIGPDKVSKSFWAQNGGKKIEIDTPRLLEQFSVTKAGTTHGIQETIPTQNIMLNHKVAHNFNIFLKSFPVGPGELKERLFIVKTEDGGLSDEHITALRRYVPTIDDVEMYKSHKGPVAELHVVDQYMMEMCNIPYLSVQLDLLLTLRELPVSMNDLQPLINQKIRMCQQLYNSRSFVSVLEYLLAIGNYLNENAGKEKAKGIRLSSLTKTGQLRGKDRDYTLLHALVEQILWHQPALTSFTEELAEFETDPGASIKGLTAEVDVLKNELQKIIQYRKASKKRKLGDAHPNFLKDLKTVIDKYQSDLSTLTKTCEEMKKLYSAILVKFGEAPDQDSQELFGVICQFIHDFKRARAETV
ncbi:hypothetical protein NQD34_005009 [Periophthalmus magnuspinnatus]|nr:hypothetical protein NQD34_005009 [Periophthalmus magnuspinnatus]